MELRFELENTIEGGGILDGPATVIRTQGTAVVDSEEEAEAFGYTFWQLSMALMAGVAAAGNESSP